MPRKAKALVPSDLVSNPATRRAFHQALNAWFKKDGRDLPWRRTHDPYAILVSEFMLQQTQVATVIPYFERWLVRFPDFNALAAAPEEEVLHAWQGLGYYARARNLHRAARFVAEQHGGELPDDPAVISELPGVGKYTAGAVGSFAFDRPVAAVDANIGRVLARIADFREPVDTPAGMAGLWEIAEALLPAKGGRLHNSALMELGALLCTPRQPQCLVCPIRPNCAATAPESLPVKKPRRKTVVLDEPCGWIEKDGKLLLERQTGSRWKGLWKLPRLEAAPSAEPIYEADYPFTHHRVRLKVFRTAAPKRAGEDQEWIPFGEIEAIAMTAPHRRAVEKLMTSRQAETANRTGASPRK